MIVDLYLNHKNISTHSITICAITQTHVYTHAHRNSIIITKLIFINTMHFVDFAFFLVASALLQCQLLFNFAQVKEDVNVWSLNSANISTSISHQFFIKRSLDDNKNVWRACCTFCGWTKRCASHTQTLWNRLTNIFWMECGTMKNRREEKKKSLSMTLVSGTCFRCLNRTYRREKKTWTTQHSIWNLNKN